MGLFDMFKRNAISNRYNDEKLYEIVLQEIENDQVRPGLWGKAFAESNGDLPVAKSLYMKLRVQSIIDDIEIERCQQAELERQERLRSQMLAAATYCTSCDNQMLRLYFRGQPTNDYQCNRCRKKVTVDM